MGDFWTPSGQRLRILYRHSFDYKARFLEPVDWGPRDYNKAADHVANCAMEARHDVDTLHLDRLREEFQGTFALQVFTDGGYAASEGCGSTGIVFTQVRGTAEGMVSTTIGMLGQHVESAKSTFHVEVLALFVGDGGPA